MPQFFLGFSGGYQPLFSRNELGRVMNQFSKNFSDFLVKLEKTYLVKTDVGKIIPSVLSPLGLFGLLHGSVEDRPLLLLLVLMRFFLLPWYFFCRALEF